MSAQHAHIHLWMQADSLEKKTKAALKWFPLLVLLCDASTVKSPHKHTVIAVNWRLLSFIRGQLANSALIISFIPLQKSVSLLHEHLPIC